MRTSSSMLSFKFYKTRTKNNYKNIHVMSQRINTRVQPVQNKQFSKLYRYTRKIPYRSSLHNVNRSWMTIPYSTGGCGSCGRI